jgi:hypothetical protein
MSTQKEFDWFPHSRMAWKGVRVRGEEKFYTIQATLQVKPV